MRESLVNFIDNFSEISEILSETAFDMFCKSAISGRFVSAELETCNVKVTYNETTCCCCPPRYNNHYIPVYDVFKQAIENGKLTKFSGMLYDSEAEISGYLNKDEVVDD